MNAAVLLRTLAVIVPGTLAGGCGDDGPPPIAVFAAASTATAMQDIESLFERETGIPVRCTFASSSTLARQIERGARADVFLSAHPQWVDHLVDRGFADPSSRVDLLGNRLAVVMPDDGTRDAVGNARDIDWSVPRRLAIGDPDHVPVGMYARQALRSLGQWETMRGRILPASDARATLRLVELGEADAGIVYASDAAASTRVMVAARLPESLHDPIRCPVILCHDADERARRFLEFLCTPRAAARFQERGFESLIDVPASAHP